MKICKECKIEKDLNEFYKRTHRLSRMAVCKACMARKAKVSREADREGYNQYQRVYYATHKDDKKATVYKWRNKNPEKMKEYRDRWIAKNPEKVKEMRMRNNKRKKYEAPAISD
jgi:hypothetical protein